MASGERRSVGIASSVERGQEGVDRSSMHVVNTIPSTEPDDVREAMLSEIISRTVIPALLSQNKSISVQGADGLHPSEAEISRLSGLILGPDNADALEYIYSLRDRGISLDDLHLELLEPTARYLGELWNNDQVDFFAVTMAVGRLQRIVHHFADLERIAPYDDKRRALIMAAPGEDHSFGAQIVQKFMRAAGWTVLSLTEKENNKVIDLVSKEWLAIVGFSMSARAHIDALAATIKLIRAKSLNPHIAIMIGGPIVLEKPELVEQVGADGTATNAASAVVLAKKLLAESLQAEKDQKNSSDLP